jgi:hypothetical protein
VYVVTEGYSETNFVKRVLCPYFGAQNKTILPITVVTNRDAKAKTLHKGGMDRFVKADNTIKNCLAATKGNSDVYVTTMFDFYRLPSDTPGCSEAVKISDHYEKVALIERLMTESERLDRPIYFPYIQLHEFEALLFSDLDKVADKYFDYDIEPLRRCLAEKKNPELINDGEETAPSKRIMKCIPDYDKATTGVAILEAIGLDTLRTKCRHFNEWIAKLEAI